MHKKQFKKVIQEAVDSAIKGDIISEGPITFAKSVGKGVKGAAQNMGGNFRANRAKSYMDQFGKKTQKTVDKFGSKALSQAQKMKTSSNPAVSQTGQKIEDEVDDTKNRVRDLVQDIDQSFPSAVGQSTQGMGNRSARRDIVGSQGVGDQALKGFYGWLEKNHGITPERYHMPHNMGGFSREAQKELIKSYLNSIAPSVPDEQEPALEKELVQKVNQQQKQAAQSQPQPQSRPQRTRVVVGKKPVPTPQAQSQQEPNEEPVQVMHPVSQPQPQVPSKPGLKATIGDMIKQKSIPPSTKQVPQQPQAAAPAQIPPTRQTSAGQPTPQERPQAKSQVRPSQAITKPQDPFSKPAPIPKQRLGLDTVGATKDDIKKLNQAITAGNPGAKQVYQALKYGNQKLAKSLFDTLKARDFQGNKSPEDAVKTGAGRKKIAPPDQFKDIVNQAAGQAASGTEPIPLTRKKEPASQDYSPPSPQQLKPQAQSHEKQPASDSNKTQSIKKVGKKRKKQESSEPLMTMADFMRQSEDDPQQKRMAKQKFKQDRKKSKNRKGKKKILIQDKDEGARPDDKFVSSDERKEEGY